MVTISQGCDYLVCIIGNIDIKLHHLVEIWARASASRKGMFRRQLHEELSHEMVWWQDQIDLKAWWGSCLGPCLPIVIVLDMKSLCGNSVMVEIMTYSFIVTYCLCKSSSLKHDGEAVISLLMITDWNPSTCRVRNVLNLLHYSYSRAGPWCHVSEWQRGHIQTVQNQLDVWESMRERDRDR